MNSKKPCKIMFVLVLLTKNCREINILFKVIKIVNKECSLYVDKYILLI